MYSFKEGPERAKWAKMGMGFEQLRSGMSKTNGLGNGFGTPFQDPLQKVYIYIAALALVAALVYQVQVDRANAAKSQPSVLLVTRSTTSQRLGSISFTFFFFLFSSRRD